MKISSEKAVSLCVKYNFVKIVFRRLQVQEFSPVSLVVVLIEILQNEIDVKACEDNELIVKITLLDPRLKKCVVITETKYKQPIKHLKAKLQISPACSVERQNTSDILEGQPLETTLAAQRSVWKYYAKPRASYYKGNGPSSLGTAVKEEYKSSEAEGSKRIYPILHYSMIRRLCITALTNLDKSYVDYVLSVRVTSGRNGPNRFCGFFRTE